MGFLSFESETPAPPASGASASPGVAVHRDTDPVDEALAHMRATLAHLAAERRWLAYLEVRERYVTLKRTPHA